MWKHSLAAVAIVTWLSGTAAAQDARTVINNASKVMGADTLKTIQYSAVGNDFAVGQSYSPTSPWPKFVNISYTRAIDFQVPASRVDRIRIQGENPPHGGGLQPVRGEQPVTQTIVVGAGTPWLQQLELWMLPDGQPPRSLGVLPAGGIARVPLVGPSDAALADIPALAVSLEPAGGSPTGLPTGPVLYSGRIERMY